MSRQTVELIGQHVALVPLTQQHIEPLFAAAGDSRIWDYMPTKVYSLEQMEQLVMSALSAQQNGVEQPFVVFDKLSDSVIGTTRYLNISDANRHLEIGWTWYHPSYWRTAVNTESKYMLLQHAFENLNVVRVQFCADSRNRRSHEGILRLGATQEGTLRKHRILSDGYIRDTCVYSILREEWGGVKTRLEGFLNGMRRECSS